MIAIIDYGVGNIFSLVSAINKLGFNAIVTSKEEDIISADKIILPGVGAFGDAMEKLESTGLKDLIISQARAGKPLLGICLGMQLLFESSTEYGYHEGLKLLPGKVEALKDVVPPSFNVPQMGWNSLRFEKQDGIFRYVKEGDFVYFVHSYYVGNTPARLAYSDYGVNVCAMAKDGNVYGAQFHPEKSGTVGLNILKAWCEGV